MSDQNQDFLSESQNLKADIADIISRAKRQSQSNTQAGNQAPTGLKKSLIDTISQHPNFFEISKLVHTLDDEDIIIAMMSLFAQGHVTELSSLRRIRKLVESEKLNTQRIVHEELNNFDTFKKIALRSLTMHQDVKAIQEVLNDVLERLDRIEQRGVNNKRFLFF